MAVKSSWVLLCVAFLILLSALPALAEDPALIGLSVGRYDQEWIDQDFQILDAGHGGDDRAVDFRLEYRFGTSLIPWTEHFF